MCSAPKIAPPAPPPAPPPTLEQLAPKSAGSESSRQKKRKGFSAYKTPSQGNAARTNKLGGIPKKTGV